MTPPGWPSILRESPDRIGAIRDLLVSAFPTEVEAEVVNDLRDASALRVALVAVDSDRVIGHLAFSPASILPPQPATTVVLALAPLAVAPDAQGRRIASAMVRAGLLACTEIGCNAVVVLGDPDYYGRFGFFPASERGLRCLFDAPPEGFMIWEVQPAAMPTLNATVHFNSAFDRFLGPNATLNGPN